MRLHPWITHNNRKKKRPSDGPQWIMLLSLLRAWKVDSELKIIFCENKALKMSFLLVTFFFSRAAKRQNNPQWMGQFYWKFSKISRLQSWIMQKRCYTIKRFFWLAQNAHSQENLFKWNEWALFHCFKSKVCLPPGLTTETYRKPMTARREKQVQYFPSLWSAEEDAAALRRSKNR